MLINVPTENKKNNYRYVAVADTSIDEDGEISHLPSLSAQFSKNI